MVVFAIHRHESAMDVHVSSYPEPLSQLSSHPIALGCPGAPALTALLHASNLHWSSILHMVIYVFQSYSFKSSHPCLLPQSPKVCSLYLCLFCCLAYRVIVTIFLNSMCYAVLSCFSHVQLFAILWTAACQASLSPSPTPRACSNTCPSSQ